MTANLIDNTVGKLSQINYSVLVEEKEGGYQATVWGLPDCQVFAATREEAMKNLQEMVNTRLKKVEVFTAVIEQPKSEHPWMKFARMYQDNPLFNEVVSHIEAYRREIDAQQIDAEDTF